MSRRNGRHAQVTSRQGRHAKPAPPNPAAAVLGTAAKVVPASLVIGVAGSAFALSGTASAATTTPTASAVGGTARTATATTGAIRTLATKNLHAAGRSSHTVIPGDTLSGISARFCGEPADYPALAAASGIANPNLIHVGQDITLACHAAPTAAPTTAASGDSDSGTAAVASDSPSSPSSQDPAQHPRTQAPATSSAGGVSTSGMSAFEACVISRESGGNPQAVNSSSDAGGLFQFLPSTWASLGYASGYPGGAQTAPVSVQKAAFAKLYAQAGTSPWSPYDGC